MLEKGTRLFCGDFWAATPWENSSNKRQQANMHEPSKAEVQNEEQHMTLLQAYKHVTTQQMNMSLQRLKHDPAQGDGQPWAYKF